MKSSSEDATLWDRIGLSASLVCVVHCLLTPFLILFMPLVGAWLEHPLIHLGLAMLIFPVGILAFRHGYLIHRRKDIIALATVGFVGIAAGLIATDRMPSTLFTIAGGLALVAAHLMNLNGCRCHPH